MRSPILLAVALLLRGAVTNTSAATLVPIPLSPANLVTCVPAAPSDWKMIASSATNTFSGGTMASHAQRELKQDPPPLAPGQPLSPPAEPSTMTIHLTDTGAKGEFTSVVLAPSSGSSASTAYLKLKDFPARIITTGEKTFILNLLIQDRFLIEIRTTNVTMEDLKKIVGNMDFSKLASMPDATMKPLSDPVIIYRVDELHPDKNRSYPLYWQPGGSP